VSNLVDAVACCLANVKLAPFTSLSDEDFMLNLKGKVLGQVNLVRFALWHLRAGGSITLTSGVFERPIPARLEPSRTISSNLRSARRGPRSYKHLARSCSNMARRVSFATRWKCMRYATFLPRASL
jgi:NAD(P)-dependent dehydrogenase (short-subunit alcohol dehydrogenase family)